jgi:uncharacterized membrane protein
MASHTASSQHQTSARALAALLGLAGLGHFIATDTYELIIPRFLPAPRTLVLASGAAEIACAGLLLFPATRKAGAWCAFGLFLAVWPANVQMALDGGIPGRHGLLGSPAAAWLRLPLQLPLLYWAFRVGRSGLPGRKAHRVHDPA